MTRQRNRWRERQERKSQQGIPGYRPETMTTKDGGKVVGDALDIAEMLPGRNFSSVWSSPEKFALHVEKMDKREAWSDSAWDNDENFAGSRNMQEALDLFRDGWKEGAEQIERLRGRIQAMNPRGVKMTRYSIAGAYPNVPRAVAGNILNMKNPDESRSRKRPIITLLCNMCANWTIPAATISNRAAVVAALIDEIESAGYSCEVISCALTRGGFDGDGKFTAATSVVVKKSDQPVDTMRLAFGIGHASMFRRLIFADWQFEKSCENGLGYGLGSARGNDFGGELNEKSIYTIPSCEDCSEDFKTEDKAATDGLKMVVQALAKQGCPAFKHIEIEKEPENLTATQVQKRRRIPRF